jgi:uncharacterized protein (TIGR02647 family)
MAFSSEQIAELDLLLLFPDTSHMQGLKIHHDADPAKIAAAQRLFEKGVITQIDGGYLTELGHDLAKHVNILQSALAK